MFCQKILGLAKYLNSAQPPSLCPRQPLSRRQPSCLASRMTTTQWSSLRLTFQDPAFVCSTHTGIWAEDIFNRHLGRGSRGMRMLELRGLVSGGGGGTRLQGSHLGVIILATLVLLVHKAHAQVPVQPVLAPGTGLLILGCRLPLSVERGQRGA